MDTNLTDLKEGEAENGKVDIAEQLSPEEISKMPVLEDMAKAGFMYGRKKSKMHPHMKPYVFAIRSGMVVFDLPKSLRALEKAEEFLKTVISLGGKILVVGTQPAGRDLAKQFAEGLSQLYVNERWLGGMITNFKTISGRIEYFKKQKSDLASGKLDKYTKKERLMMEREINKLNMFFGGVEGMTTPPQAMLIINPVLHETALREAQRSKIPVVAFMTSDADPDVVDYPITGNCAAKASIAWLLDRLNGSLKDVKPSAVLKKPAEEPKK